MRVLALIAGLGAVQAASAQAADLTLVQQGIDPWGVRISGDGTALAFTESSVPSALLWHQGQVETVWPACISSCGYVADGVSMRAPVSADLLLLHYDYDAGNPIHPGLQIDAGIETSLFGLALFPPGELIPMARVEDASADGRVVVGSSTFSAMRWDDTVPSFLPAGDPSDFGLAYGVSSAGDVIVGVLEAHVPDGIEATRWMNGGFEYLGDLPGGSRESMALDVSADGATSVGYATVAAGSAGRRAVRWVGTTLEPLGTLGPGAGQATSASGDGGIVLGQSNGRPFIWTQASGMRDLNVFLRNQALVDMGSFTVTLASISDDGLVIGGVGQLGVAEGSWLAGVDTAFVVTLDAPTQPVPLTGAAGALTLAAALALAGALAQGRIRLQRRAL